MTDKKMTGPHHEADSLSDGELSQLFDAARGPQLGDMDPPAHLMQAILADAEALQPMPVASKTERGFEWRDLREAVGGWFGLGGLVAASVTSLMIGVAAPDAGAEMLALITGDTVILDSYTGFETLYEEG